jgi:hypothetical protein
MTLQTLTVLLASGGKNREPPKEAKLFTFGTNETLKGDFVLTRTGAQELMAKYQAWGVKVMLDYEHMSHNPNATAEQKKAAGRAELELREDGIYLVDISWTPQADEFLRNAEYMYLSPAFKLNDDGEIVELINVALVNMPATIDQEQLVAASRLYLSQETHMHKLKEHLTAALSKFGGHEQLAKHLGMTHEKLTALLSGNAPTHEEMKKCAVALGLEEHELEDEKAPIDTSYNGQDVDKSKGNKDDKTPEALGGLFELMGGEANVPHSPMEADENQKGTLKMSRAAAEAMIKLSADPKHRDEVIDFVVGLQQSAARASKDVQMLSTIREQVAKEKREQLIDKHKAKLNPALISLCRSMDIKALEVFLSALPAPNRPFEEPANPSGGSKVITLSREEKEIFQLAGMKEPDILLAKEIAADMKLVALSTGYVGPKDKGSDAEGKAGKTNWDRKYGEHVMHLSIFGETPDGQPWRPADGSVLWRNGEKVTFNR